MQEDIALLRARVEEEQESLHRDERVRKLQIDRDAFRAEVSFLFYPFQETTRYQRVFCLS